MIKDFAPLVHKISCCKFRRANRTCEQQKKMTKYATAYVTDVSRIDRSVGQGEGKLTVEYYCSCFRK